MCHIVTFDGFANSNIRASGHFNGSQQKDSKAPDNRFAFGRYRRRGQVSLVLKLKNLDSPDDAHHWARKLVALGLDAASSNFPQLTHHKASQM